MVVHAIHTTFWKVTAGVSQIKGHPWLHSKVKDNKGYKNRCIPGLSVFMVILDSKIHSKFKVKHGESVPR